MPSVDPRETFTNQYLSDVALTYRAPGAIGYRIFPAKGVPHQIGTVIGFDKVQWLRGASTQHNYGESPKTSLPATTVFSFNCQGYAHGAILHNELWDNSDIDVLGRLTENVLDRLTYDYETRCVSKVFTNVGTTFAAPVAFTVQSGNVGTSCPISYFNVLIETVRATTGLRPNTFVIPQQVMNVLQTHPDIRANGIGDTTQERLASILQIDPANLLIPTLRILTNQEGQPNTFADVWSTCVLAAYIEPASPSMRSFGLTFRFPGPGKGFSGPPPATEVFQVPDAESGRTVLYCRFYSDERVTVPELGALLTTGI
jgi:hypothetical protein